MKTSHTILSALSLSALAVAATVSGCSSEDSSVPTTSTPRDAGTTSTADATTPRDAGTTTTTDAGTTTTDAGTTTTVDAGCANVFVPSVRDAGGIYCYKGGADAGNYCATGDICCVTKTDAGSNWNACSASSACSFDAGAVRKFECIQASDCTGGTVCCSVGATEAKAQCSYDQASNATHKGTICKATCEAGDQKVCNANSDCPSGQTCRPTTIFGTYVGTCR